jgi:hypothetical protein
MFAMMGLITHKGIIDRIPELSYAMADAMLEARKPTEEGLVAIKRKVKAK